MTAPSVSSEGALPGPNTSDPTFEGLSDLLECSVCLEPLGSAHRVLPCQHTFCIACLEDLVNKQKKKKAESSKALFNCPECRAEVTTPISALPTNVILNRILSGLSNQARPSSSLQSSPVVNKPPKAIPPPLPIGDHRKLPLPNSSIKFDNNNIPGNWSTNPFLAGNVPSTPESPLPILPPKVTPLATPPPIPARPPLQSSSSPHQLYRALYDYKPVKIDELALRKGELYIVIEKCQDGWFKGSSLTSLKTGVFPGNYVQHVQEHQQQGKGRQSPDLIDLTSDIMDVFASPNTSSQKTQQNVKKDKKEVASSAKKKESLILYRATMPFPASSPYELELKMGDVISMTKIREDGWCKGTLERSGQSGLFPLSFVEKIS